MSEIAAQTGRDLAGTGLSGSEAAEGMGDVGVSGEAASEQAKEKLQDAAEQAKVKVQDGAEVVQEKTQELKVQAGERVRQELDNRSTQAGSQLQGTAEAMRRTGQQLRQEGKDGPAQVTTFVAERAERLAGYLSGADSDRMLRDLERFARRRPWLVAAGGATLGFLASRFLKASSSGRYQTEGSGGQQQEPWQPESASLPGAERAIPSGVSDEAGYAIAGTERGGSNG